MTNFIYQDMLPAGQDATDYRLLTEAHLSTAPFDGQEVLKISAQGLTYLAEQAFKEISHLLRPAHLKQLAGIFNDPQSSANDRYVALELLKNAVISAEGIFPMCQDTGTAIVIGKKGQRVWTDSSDEESLSKGIYNAYTKGNLRYSQNAPLSMYEEKNSGSNLPAQIELYAVGGDEYRFLFIAKGGGSANKTFLYQETKAVLTPENLTAFMKEKMKTLGTAACPPYHLAFVIGGTSAEFNLKTVKLATAKYLDDLPTAGSESGHAFRDLQLEDEILKISRDLGIGAQFGGKYFCLDTRVIRLPRHGASCPIGLGVSCSADRNVKAKITREGIFIEKLETDPARYLPEVEVSSSRGGTYRFRPADGENSTTAKPASGGNPTAADRQNRGRTGHRPCRIKKTPGQRRHPSRLFQKPYHLLCRTGKNSGRLPIRLIRPDNRGSNGSICACFPGSGGIADYAGQGEPVKTGDGFL